MDREFTLEEARAALDVVRDAIDALQQIQGRLRAFREELAALGRRHLNNGVVAEQRVRDLRRQQRVLAEEARTHATAIRDAGAELKSIDQGLIDFPTHIEGVAAYWCWRAGEADIDWWHPRNTGFADRRRIGQSA